MIPSNTPGSPSFASPEKSANVAPGTLAAQDGLISRRTALLGAASVLLTCQSGCSNLNHSLFWQVTPPGRKGAVLFGYARIAAQAMPEIVSQGETVVAACQRIVNDMPQNTVLPTINSGPGKPILQSLAPQQADRLRQLVATTQLAPLVDRLNGFGANLFLVGEGTRTHGTVVGSGGASQPSIGGVIFDYARSLGKPVDQVLSEAEVRSAFAQADVAAVVEAFSNPAAIAYLLELRDRIGPIGAYFEQQYRAGNVEEMARLSADLIRHDAFSVERLMHADRLRDLWLERAWNILTEQADELLFMPLPVAELGGPSGVLAAFRSKGAAVFPRTFLTVRVASRGLTGVPHPLDA